MASAIAKAPGNYVHCKSLQCDISKFTDWKENGIQSEFSLKQRPTVFLPSRRLEAETDVWLITPSYCPVSPSTAWLCRTVHPTQRQWAFQLPPEDQSRTSSSARMSGHVGSVQGSQRTLFSLEIRRPSFQGLCFFGGRGLSSSRDDKIVSPRVSVSHGRVGMAGFSGPRASRVKGGSQEYNEKPPVGF